MPRWSLPPVFTSGPRAGGFLAYKILAIEDVDRRPPVRWLVKGVLPANALAMLYSPSGYGKSFVALDLAHCLGLGNSWLGFDVNQGGAMYVAAGEGAYGLKQRTKAWRVFNCTDIENVHYGIEPVQLHSETSVRGFVRALEGLDLSLVVIDTLARCAVGVDENSVEEIGPVIQGCDYIREKTGAAVLLVHHATKPDKDGRTTYRGSTALEAASDTMMVLSRDPEHRERLLLSCHKQKEAREFWPVRLALESIPVGVDQESAVPVLR